MKILYLFIGLAITPIVELIVYRNDIIHDRAMLQLTIALVSVITVISLLMIDAMNRSKTISK